MMENPWAFITGISDGVGRSLAVKLIHEKYNVIGLSRSRPTYISDYPNIHWFPFDLSERFDEDIFRSSVNKHTDKLRLVVFNAARAHYGKIKDLPLEELERMAHTNLIATIHMLRQILPIMEKGGQIILVGSSAEYFPAPNMGLYAALKAAQSHLAMTLNVENIHEDIQFKIIRPGFINTDFGKKSGEPENNTNRYMALSPDKVADDIFRLTRKNVYFLNSGYVSKLMYWLNRVSTQFCFSLSVKKHRNHVRGF